MNVILFWRFKKSILFFLSFSNFEKKKLLKGFGGLKYRFSLNPSLCSSPLLLYLPLFFLLYRLSPKAHKIIHCGSPNYSLFLSYVFMYFSPTYNCFFLIFSLEFCQKSMGILRSAVVINNGNVFSSEVQV